MRGFGNGVLAICLGVGLASGLCGQDPVAPAVPSQFPPPPATKLEGFQPPTGAVFSIAHESLGSPGGVQVDVLQMSDAQGKAVRGLIVYISDGSGLKRSYVDADELPGLLQACDTLLDLGSNPTALRTYEARYATRGNLELKATTSDRRGTLFSVKVGRFETATKESIGTTEMQQLRAAFSAAADKLAALQQ